MKFGGWTCLIGGGITLLTHAIASGGGSYVVAWGAMLFGAARFIRGAVALSRLGPDPGVVGGEPSVAPAAPAQVLAPPPIDAPAPRPQWVLWGVVGVAVLLLAWLGLLIGSGKIQW